MMFLTKLKLAAAVALTFALCGGTGGLTYYHLTEAQAESPPPGAPIPVIVPLPTPEQASIPPLVRNIKVPSEMDGKLLGIFTEIKADEKVADKDVIVVGKQKYRRLRVGDEVAAGQLLARIDDALVREEVLLAEAKIDAAEAELSVSIKTKDEARSRYERMGNANQSKPGTFAQEEVSGSRLAYERYIQEELAKRAQKIVAQRELNQVKTRLQMYEIRSPVRGLVKVVHKQLGEAVQRWEAVLEILPLDD